MDILIVIICLSVFFLFVPVKRKCLVEGLFKEEREDYDFSRDRKLKCFYFEDFCRDCVEEWRRTGEMPEKSLWTQRCGAAMSTFAINIGLLKPEIGKAVSLIAWQTIFGRVVFYYFQPSNFEWTTWMDEEDRQEAKKLGFPNVATYKADRLAKFAEECILEAMQEHGLSREEAEVLEPLGSGSIRSLNTESKRTGISASMIEAAEMDLLENETNCPIDYSDAVTYLIEERTLDPEVLGHLRVCWRCNQWFTITLRAKASPDFSELSRGLNLRDSHEMHAEELGITPAQLTKRIEESLTLRYGGKNCFGMKERITFARTGDLTAEARTHIESCIGCQRMVIADRADFLERGKI